MKDEEEEEGVSVLVESMIRCKGELRMGIGE